MIAIAENIWDQIEQKGLRNHFMKRERVKTALRAFTYSYIDIYNKQYSHDKKKINIIKQLRDKYMILKLNKGNGVVLMNKADYHDAMNELFSDKTKFKIIKNNPTLTRLKTVQNYLNNLCKGYEITEAEKKQMRPMSAQLGRAHGLPKIHKVFANILKFRPIIDRNNTPYYKTGQYLSSLLQPLTINDYTLKDSFDAANKIKSVPSEMFEEGYQFVSFDVESLFTNMPLNKTINIILDRIYRQKLLKTNLKKRAMKKLLLDSCTKTAFSYDNILYQQCDGVSMDSSLAPVLSNIILTEFEKVVVMPLMESGILKFYCRYVDDTSVLVKEDQIDKILKAFNSFHNNLRFTVDKFENKNVHFFDLKIMNNGDINIYVKDTNSGLYINYNNYEPWHTKTAWVRALYGRAHKICSNENLFQKQVARIKKVMSWNGYPRYIRIKIIKRLENRKNAKNNYTLEQENIATIFCRIPYAGVQGETLIKNLVRKLQRHIDKPFKLRNIYPTKKLSYYCNTKDKVPEFLKSHIVYEFCCPACNIKYIGKTDRNFVARVQEQSGLDKKSPVYNHLFECEHFSYVVNMHSLSHSNSSAKYLEHVTTDVYDNIKISVKWKKSKLNCGAKATK